MTQEKKTPKQELVETVISEMKKGIAEGKICAPYFAEGWEEYRKRISRLPAKYIRNHLQEIRSGRYTG